MSETVLQDGDVVVRALGSLRRLTLNRPQALNAITLDMVATMTARLRDWAADPAVGAVLIDGAGDRAFCAGGDIRALYDAAKAGDSLPARFWADEYKLDVLISRYPKPVIAVMDGLVMGGGVGLSAHSAHRVVTERSAVAMPEVAIGYFPDVGVSFRLARAPWELGTYVALTGSRLGAQDALFCGLANCTAPASRLDEIPSLLADCRDARGVWTALRKLETSPSPGKLVKARDWIEHCFSRGTAEEIVEALSSCEADGAAEALDAMRKASPTALKITLRNVRTARSFARVEESFQQDYRISLACVAGHDFIEGIRAQIVDKDRKPAWRPGKLADVTPDIVERHFKSVGELELKFET
ncbi:MAG TPA: enoyl-CoA hydratase/isomerase family protein [Xanthobacteraceae bacterium]|jgi:enoyl-CoA hydratase|nr:enoyl-CoA hydratase/isomerase family protein [Xanthobacteraceae bacterium]